MPVTAAVSRSLSLVGVGVGVGMCVADFAARWMGWTGPTTVAMIGAILAWVSVFVYLAAQRSLGTSHQSGPGTPVGERCERVTHRL